MKNDQTIISITPDEEIKILLTHHLESFLDNNLEGVMSDYTEESVLLTELNTLKGLTEIRSFFYVLIQHFPKQKSSFQVEKLVIEEEFSMITWHARTPSLEVPFATDTFIFKNGKIYQQSFSGRLNFTT